MAKIKKLKENGSTIYPATILEAVLDSKTSTPLSKTRLRYSRASAHGRYYKFMSLKRGTEKGIVRFGIESPLMGYAEYMVNWTYDTNTEKGMNPYCLFSTNAQMYNRVKLVRTGNDTFDTYFESNAGNDYPAFVFMGEGGTTDSNSITGYIVSIVSAIPTIYKESTYVGNICFGTVIGTLAGTADKAAGISFANSDDAINIDEYPQAELGTIYIWLNGNQADGNVPNYPENGVIIQSHFRFENDEGEYKYRYTQMFVGKNGTLYSRTSAEGSTLGFTPSSWEEWNRSGCNYFYLGEMTVGNTLGSNAAEVTFSSGSSAFSALKAILDTYPNSASYIPDIQLCFALKTSSTTQYVRAKMLSLLSTTTGTKTLFFLYQNALYGESNYLNVLRMVFSPSSSIPGCNTLNMKI